MVNKITFPSFSNSEYSQFDMRQLVSALELRFGSLEANTENLFDTGTAFDGVFSPIGHTHSESEITDLQPYLININSESIFDLSDVTGTPALNHTLTWNGTAFVPTSPSATTIALDDLTDVSIPAPLNGEALIYNSTTMVWEAGSNATSFFNLTDTDLSSQGQYDLVFNADGTEWQDTNGELIWNPIFDYLQLANAHSINWLNALSQTVELLDFTANSFFVGDTLYPTELDGTFIGLKNSIGVNWDDGLGSNLELLILNTQQPTGTPDPDPFLGSVTFLASFENGTVGSEAYSPEIGPAIDWQLLSGVQPTNADGEVSNGQATRGLQSLYFKETAGITNAGWATVGTTTVGDFTGDFTIEIDVYIVDWTSQVELLAKWDFPDFQWNLAIAAGASSIEFEVSTTGSNLVTIFTGAAFPTEIITLNEWNTIAICRSGNNWHAFCNGEESSSSPVTDSSVINIPAAQTLVIGQEGDNDGAGTIEAYVDNIRITEGAARYITDYIPTTEAYDGTSGTSNVDPDFANVVFLCHWDGANGAQTSLDISANPHTITWTGGGLLETANAVFGTAALGFPARANYVSIATTSDFAFATNDFTIETIFNPDELNASSQLIYDQRTAATQVVPAIYTIGAGGDLRYFVNGADRISATGVLTAGVTYRVAISRVSGTTRMFLDGTQVGSSYADANSYVDNAIAYLGTAGDAVGGGFGLIGFMDETRVTNGVGRYATNYTVSTAAFGGGLENTFIVGDPAAITQIDGLTTNITSAATDIDGTLNVDGASTFGGVGTFQGAGIRASLLTALDEISLLSLRGGLTEGANIELYGPTHGSTPDDAFYEADQHTFRNIVGTVGATMIPGTSFDITDALTLASKFNINTTTVTTTSHTAANEHVILVDDDTAAATVTVTLPAAVTAETIYHIKKLGTTASVIIDGNASETIDGSLTITLTAQYESVMLVSNGTFWSIL